MTEDQKTKHTKLIRSIKKNSVTVIYIVVIAWVSIVVFFTGEHSAIECLKGSNRESAIENEIEQYKTNIEKTQKDIDKFEKDKCKLEHLARETYLMRKSNEDVFIVE